MTKLIRPKPELKLRPTLYWAYGSNLSKENMSRRCPDAKLVKPFILGQLELVFRVAADVRVVKDDDAITPGGLWKITPACEAALDFAEGVAKGTYIKRYFQINHAGKKHTVLFYQMRTHRGIIPPTVEYYNIIAQGYRDFGLPIGFLEEALEKAWNQKTWTPELMRRWRDKGRPEMMRNGG